MSNIWEDDDELETPSNTGGGLRAQLEQALADLKEARSTAAQLQKERDENRASSILADRGYPAKVAKFALADGIDVSDVKALEKWLDDNSDSLPTPQSKQSQDDEESHEEPQVPGLEDAYSAMSRIHTKSAPGMSNKFEAAMAGLSKSATPEEVLEAFKGL